jgi:hypothetical protein
MRQYFFVLGIDKDSLKRQQQKVSTKDKGITLK